MEYLALVAYLAIGAAAGFLAGLLGIGGGVLIVPSLILVFHLIGFPQDVLIHTAIGTSLASIVITSAVSTIAHHFKKGVHWDLALLMFPGIIIGALMGAFLADFLNGVVLKVIFGLFICALGALILWPLKQRQKKKKRLVKTVLTWSGFGIGGLGSLLGIGGGVFTVPLLLHYEYQEKEAVGTSAAVTFMISAMSSLAYVYFGKDHVKISESFGYVYLPAFFLIGIGAAFLAPLGTKYAHEIPGQRLRKIFAGLLILIGLVMIFS